MNICVPIVGQNSQQIEDKAKEIAKLPIQLCEWRVDFYEDMGHDNEILAQLVRLKAILKEIPLIFTLRTHKEGGNRYVLEEDIVRVIRTAIISEIPEFVDIEAFENQETVTSLLQLAKLHHMKTIGSYHNFEQTLSQEELVQKFLRMEKMDFSVAKIAVMPNEQQDVITLLTAAREASSQMKIPLICMSMGDKGMISRVYGDAFGSTVTFAAAGTCSAPGQLSVQQLLTLRKRHIILTGFMGTGKTTIVHELAKLTKRPYFDTDERIEEEEKMSISDMFEQQGEAYFRKCETKLCQKLASEQPSIVACGGGLVLRDENVSYLRQAGDVICLTAAPRTLYERLKDTDNRPLLRGKMSVEGIGELLLKRQPAYEKAGDIQIAVDDGAVEDIAWNVLFAIIENEIHKG